MSDEIVRSDHGSRDETGEATSQSAEGLQTLGSSAFAIEGDVHKLITFLNQTLKDKGYIFGLSKHPDGLTVTIYQTNEA